MKSQNTEKTTALQTISNAAKIPEYTPANVKKLMAKLDLNEKAFAFLMNVSPSAVRYWTTGAAKPCGLSRREGQIQAFIVNVDRLAEGDHVAAWHPFPCTAEEMAATLKEIGVDGERYIETAIEDYAAKVPGLARHLRPDADLNELNYLATKMELMDTEQLEIFAAAVEAREHTANMRDLINLTGNLDSYMLNPAAHNERSLGLLQFEIERDLANTAKGALEASTYADTTKQCRGE